MEQSPSWEANWKILQLIKKFPAFYGTRKFITVLTSARHLSLSWANPIQSPQPLPPSWRSILILSCHLGIGLPSGLFPSGFPTKTLCTCLPSSIRATCPAHPITEYNLKTGLYNRHRFCSRWGWNWSFVYNLVEIGLQIVNSFLLHLSHTATPSGLIREPTVNLNIIHIDCIYTTVITYTSTKWLSHSKWLKHTVSGGSQPVTSTDKFVNYLKTTFRLQGLCDFEQNRRMIMYDEPGNIWDDGAMTLNEWTWNCCERHRKTTEGFDQDSQSLDGNKPHMHVHNTSQRPLLPAKSVQSVWLRGWASCYTRGQYHRLKICVGQKKSL